MILYYFFVILANICQSKIIFYFLLNIKLFFDIMNMLLDYGGLNAYFDWTERIR